MYTNTRHQLFACNSGLKNVQSLKLGPAKFASQIKQRNGG